jgi:acyl-CoA thioester hydrolase
VEPTPLFTAAGAVRPEWIDYNGHMMDGYYAVAFAAVTDLFLELVGFGPAYPAASGHSVYTVESHLVYLRELRAGAGLAFTTQLLGHDERRIHMIHTMAEAGDGRPAATNELLLVHVRQSPAGVVPMPAAALAQLAALAAAHAAHPPPPQAGRRVALRR